MRIGMHMCMCMYDVFASPGGLRHCVTPHLVVYTPYPNLNPYPNPNPNPNLNPNPSPDPNHNPNPNP